MSDPTHFEFTRTRVDAATCPAGKSQALLWDTKQPGLGLRVTAGGKSSFIFEGRIGRQTIRVTIGPASMPIRVPRDRKGNPTGPGADGEALRLLALVKAGTDPRAEKAATMARDVADRDAAKVEQQRQQVTGLDAWDTYTAAKASQWGEWSCRDHARAVQEGGEQRQRSKTEKTQAGPLRPLLSRPLALVDADAVQAWLKAETAARPTVAARNFRLLRAFLRWCGEHAEFSAIVQADAHKPRRVREHLPKVGTKDDCLQREQLGPWFDAVRQIQNPVISAYLQCLLLTGARREELAGLRWDDVDFRWCGLSIRDKVDGVRVIPLTPYVSRLLVALPRRNEWVFSSPTAASGRIQEPRIAHEKALQVAGLPHLTAHGLRRSFGTLCEWVEMPAGVVAQIQGHKPSATAEKHYRRRPLDLLRMWHIRAEAWMLEQAGIEQPSASEEPTGLRVVAGR
ncbi:MAG: tyrosine-type recombinase/integrase [Leptothrix sp. (in: b-proteobacteria)]